MTSASFHASADPQQFRLLRVCRIGRAQGLKGEVNVLSFTDDPEFRYAPGSQLVTNEAEKREFTIVSSRRFKQRWILRFRGITDRNAAELLNGVELFVEEPLDNADDEDDGIYFDDLVDLKAYLVDGTYAGVISNVLDNPGQTLLEITEPHGSVSLVPFVEALIPDVDTEKGRILLDLPTGLLQEQ